MTCIKRAFGAACLFLSMSAFLLAGEGVPVMAIVHTNDIHGRFAASDKAIGHDAVAAIYRETRNRIPATLLLDAGDAVQGSPLVKWNKGRAAIEIMNRTGYDGMALGNHEFDYGWDTLLELAALAEFPFFTQPVVSEGAKGLEAAALYERGGRRIGVFGLTTPETKQVSGGGMDREFGDRDYIFAYADAMVASLRRAGAEAVVCLAHIGVDDTGFITSYALRDRVEGIDVIVDGHSHTPLAEIRQSEGGALIVSTGEHGQNLGIVEFFCENGRLRPFARTISREDAADAARDAAVTAAIAGWADRAEARGASVVAWTPAALDAELARVRVHETEVGNVLADAIRAATGADAAFMNGGSIRASLPQGDLTVNDMESILPYDTILLTADVPGGVVREALELSVASYPEQFGGFLHASGIAFTFDPSRPSGKRITAVEIGGEALDDDRRYALSISDWLAGGGDGYGMFVEHFRNPSRVNDEPLLDVFIRHLNANKDKTPAIEGRIVIMR